MKYIIIGLGNFGSTLAELLTEMGHEVIGVDRDMERVEAFKDSVTHTICMNSADPIAVANLPLKNSDIVINCIGEDDGANLMTTALLKQAKPKRLISRALSPLHETILEAMGIEEIFHPERETAQRWAKKLSLKGVIESFELSDDYSIIEAKVPARYIGRTVGQVDFRHKYNVVVLTTLKFSKETNAIGASTSVLQIKGVATDDTVLEQGDMMVIYGNMRDLKKILE